MNCRDVEKYLQSYVDGEFSPEEETEIEQHFKFCPVCQKKVAFAGWFRREFKKSMPDVSASNSFKVGMRNMLYEEARRSAPLAYKLAPAMAMLVLLLLVGVVYLNPTVEVSSPVVEATVDRHVSQLPLDVASNDYNKVQKYLQKKINYAVSLPRFRNTSMALVGGRLVSVQDRPAAYVNYRMQDRNYTMLAAPLEQFRKQIENMRSRIIGRHRIFLTRHNGFNVVLWHDNRTLYSITSDDDENQLIKVVAQAESESEDEPSDAMSSSPDSEPDTPDSVLKAAFETSPVTDE